jgi:hypothetical protein
MGASRRDTDAQVLLDPAAMAAAAASASAEAVTLSNYIDGQFVPPADGTYLDDIDPATGLVIARVPRSKAADVDAAARAAQRAAGHWAQTPFTKRYVARVTRCQRAIVRVRTS